MKPDFYVEGHTAEGAPYGLVHVLTELLRWDALEYAVEMQRKQPAHSYAVFAQSGQPLYGRHVPGTECEERTIVLEGGVCKRCYGEEVIWGGWLQESDSNYFDPCPDCQGFDPDEAEFDYLREAEQAREDAWRDAVARSYAMTK